MSLEEQRQWEQRLGLVLVPFVEPIPLPAPWGRTGQVAHAIRCHPIAADPFRAAFLAIAAAGLWPELKTFGGGFVVRAQRGSEHKWSTHSFGLAGDFDVLGNPLGAAPTMNPSIVRIFEVHGFTWGGHWGRPDGMHVQFAGGY